MEVALFFLFIFVFSILLTVLNIRGLIKKQHPRIESWEIFAIVLGFYNSVMFYSDRYDYDAIVIHSGYIGVEYSPLASWHLLTFLTLCILSFFAYVLLCHKKILPPIITAIGMSALLIGCVLAFVFILQVGVINQIGILPLLFPINIILLYSRVIHLRAKEMATKISTEPPKYTNPLLKASARFLCFASSWVFVSFLLALPLFCVVMVVLVLFGQRPDAIVKVFTDTAAWTFSQQVPNPDRQYVGHYLCTVAAEGDPRLVHPLRQGWRQGRKITVNRQLCVANSFEQVISEQFPRFHRIIRSWYDTYGYPLSKHITTPLRANIVYILMKPLEYFFIVFLYCVDTKPENRIAMQYLPPAADLQ